MAGGHKSILRLHVSIKLHQRQIILKMKNAALIYFRLWNTEYHGPYLAFDGIISSSVFRSLLIILFFLLHAVNVPVDVLNNFVY